MKISILLPYKENFSPDYPGAVSLFINDTQNISRYKKNITVYGNTNYKRKFKIKYKNIDLKKRFFQSQNKIYVEKFIKIENENSSDLIEVHNRPIYISLLSKKLTNRTLVLYFHNDPLTMSGSKNINERVNLLKQCFKIIFNSNWSKKRFLEGMKNDYINSDKLVVINQSAKKNNNKIKKKNIITFVGKLNRSKGYDLFGKAIIKILNKYKNWTSVVAGDEPRDKIDFDHKNLIKKGFVDHNKVIKIYQETSIAVVCSRWEEPFGRSSLEAAANGCAVIISNKGGLPETITNGIILKKLDSETIYKEIEKLIINSKRRKELQNLSLKNFYLTHKYISGLIDNIRNQKFIVNKRINIYPQKKPKRILHVTNFNERHNGRLFFNTGRRINNGFIRLGNSVLEFSDRDIQKNYKSYNDFSGSKSLNDKLRINCYNYKPDLIVLGHADLISPHLLGELKDEYPGLRIAQWFLDPLNKNGPDYIKNKKRILDKSDFIDANFITTSPDVLEFLPKKKQNYFIPNPSDPSFEILNNYRYSCSNDVFFALSHGVHRGSLKYRTYDDREILINKLIKKSKNIKFDIYGLNNVQPIWADQYFKTISNSKMGLNLSRGSPIKYYSSDRLTQITGNGLVTLIDKKTGYQDFFTEKEMVFYENVDDLSEKIIKISRDEKLRKSIGKKGKAKYLKYFNSTLVANFIINKTLEIKDNRKYLWHKN